MIHTRVARQKPLRLIADLGAGRFAINAASLSPSSIARCPAKLSVLSVEMAKLVEDLRVCCRYVVDWFFYLRISLRASDMWKLVYIYINLRARPDRDRRSKCSATAAGTFDVSDYIEANPLEPSVPLKPYAVVSP